MTLLSFIICAFSQQSFIFRHNRSQ